MDPELIKKKREYEARKARTKLALNICTICGKKDARPCKGCGTTSYCSTDCQRIDWRDRGHRKACKKIRDDRARAASAAWIFLQTFRWPRSRQSMRWQSVEQ